MVEHRLLDYLVRTQQQRVRDREAERLRRREIDDQLELRGLLDGEIGGLRAFENLIYVSGGATKQVMVIRRVFHQTSKLDGLPVGVNAWQTMPGCKVDDEAPIGIVRWRARHKERISTLADDDPEGFGILSRCGVQ